VRGQEWVLVWALLGVGGPFVLGLVVWGFAVGQLVDGVVAGQLVVGVSVVVVQVV